MFSETFVYLFLFSCFQLPQFILGHEDRAANPTLWESRQAQISSIFNFFCLRNDVQIAANSSGFSPLAHLSLYSNPAEVKSFVEALESGQRSPRWGPYLADLERSDTIPMINTLYFINTTDSAGWDLFYNTTAYFSLRTNVRQFLMAMELIFSTKFFGLLRRPEFSSSIPQFFNPAGVIRGINDISVTEPVSAQTPLNYKEPTYWCYDSGYREFHFSWNMDLPPDLHQEKYGLKFDRKGELFLYSHHYMEIRYFAERLSSGWSSNITALSLEGGSTLRKGYDPFFLNADFSDWPIRGPNSSLTTQEGFGNLVTWEKEILNAFEQGFANDTSGNQYPLHAVPETEESDIAGTDVFGAFFQSTTASINLPLYGNLHESLHINLAILRDSRYPTRLPRNVVGVMDHAESSVTDSAFYRLHLYVDNLYKKHKYASSMVRSKENLAYSGVELHSVQIQSDSPSHHGNDHVFPVLTTHSERFTEDVSNAVMDCQKLEHQKVFTYQKERLNHIPFSYNMSVFSSLKSAEDVIVRIFMASYLQLDGSPFPEDEFYWNMIEMDKFPFILKPGENSILRSSRDSSITKKHHVAATEPRRNCGWPENLLLPKGTARGLHTKFFVFIGPAGSRDGGAKLTVANEKEYLAHSLCGHPYLVLPDDKPLGYPFDKRLVLKDPFSIGGGNDVRNYGFYDVIIKHLL